MRQYKIPANYSVVVLPTPPTDLLCCQTTLHADFTAHHIERRGISTFDDAPRDVPEVLLTHINHLADPRIIDTDAHHGRDAAAMCAREALQHNAIRDYRGAPDHLCRRTLRRTQPRHTGD